MLNIQDLARQDSENSRTWPAIQDLAGNILNFQVLVGKILKIQDLAGKILKIQDLATHHMITHSRNSRRITHQIGRPIEQLKSRILYRVAKLRQ